MPKAQEKYPDATPRLFRDHGPQFIAREFKHFIRISGRTPSARPRTIRSRLKGTLHMVDVSPLTALIVTANEERRYALDQPLRNQGFKIRDAGNGAEGIRLAMEIPDIVILDPDLPDMSGFDVCCRLKALGGGRIHLSLS